MHGICFLHDLFDELALPNGLFKRHLQGQTSSPPAGHWSSLRRRNSAHLSRIKSTMLRHAAPCCTMLCPEVVGVMGVMSRKHSRNAFRKRTGSVPVCLWERKLIIANPNKRHKQIEGSMQHLHCLHL